MIEIEPATVPQARKSVAVVAIVLALIGAWQQYRERPRAAQILGAIVVLLIITAMIPRAAQFFHKWWMTLAGVLGYINSRILLSIIFYLLLAPTGFFLRLFGHDPLTRRGAKEPSYWRIRTKTRQDRIDYERAF